jgi:hypothetical protein
LRKKYAGPSNIYNNIFEQLRSKLEKHISSNNMEEKRVNLEKNKTKKVILKPIEIKDPRLYLPSSTGVKFDINRQDIPQNDEKNFIKNKLHLEEIKENQMSPSNAKSKKYSNFAKTTYVDHLNYYEDNQDKIVNNNISGPHQPQMNTTIVASQKPNLKIRLEELITLKVLKRNKNLGVVKKMVHAPSLKIYTVKV